MNESTAPVTFDLPIEVKERLDALARRTDQPASDLVVEAIRSYVEIQDWQVQEIEQGFRDAEAGDFATDEEVATVFAKYVRR